MSSTALYNCSTAGYLISLSLFAFHVINTRKFLLRTGIVIVALSFLIQTLGLGFRWAEAGFFEIDAVEHAIGQALTGWSWFVVFTQHPPWSNLYEIMVYMSWGIIMVMLAAELKWQFAWVRQLGIILALMALGVAALTDATIKPLVPALKSWWIMIHVISASIAYAAGAIASFICLFALMKDTVLVKKESLYGGALIFLGVLLCALGGGTRLILEQTYFVKLQAFAGESMVSVLDMSKANGVPFLVAMPFVGYSLIIAVLSHVVCGGVVIACKPLHKIFLVRMYIACFFLSVFSLMLMLFHDIKRSGIVVQESMAHHLAPAGPWFISFTSHAWSLWLLVLVVLLETLLLIYLLAPHIILERLPPVLTLEGASYKTISLSFFLMTIVLITGALWAHYAWGRYWAWDPKETGALAIWLNYAIYLHTKRTSGLSGPFSSAIGVFGFFVIIVGFLGVNLGLFANGLHTYGNS